ncbi:MAG: UvrD-helicase domain-containing protein [Spirochaetes bacterium]|jgi:exodeoxyribonuclease V beta subunit|nr:UvrD-helicase domain-containing protein [Spirochaetota bacterium]
MKAEILTDLRKIDLDSNLLIEASAGTGKTTTIENLVLDLLLKGKVSSLSEILIVTFTEKATSELKEKIRKKIYDSFTAGKSQILQESLDNFDSAQIYTIHGFCNKVLTTYAFENAGHLQSELVFDKEIYSRLLHDRMRKTWPRIYAGILDELLILSGYPLGISNGESNWENTVIDIAMKYRSAEFESMLPPPDPYFHQIVKKYNEEINQRAGILKKLFGEQINRPEDHDIYKLLSGLPCRQKSTIINRVVFPLLEILSLPEVTLSGCKSFIDGLAGAKTTENLLKEGFEHLLDVKKGEIIDTFLMGKLTPIIDFLNYLGSIDFKNLSIQLAANTAMELKNEIRIHKNLHGMISYDDMILNVYNALHDESSPLPEIIQKKYRYGIIDESQDTDLYQWTIFKRIFLEEKKNRLFLIGDPKQAIYGFRGADVHAYYTARDEMISRFGARYYTLNTNYRSIPELISFFNGLFGKKWFSEKEITYTDSRPPEKSGRRAESPDDGACCVNLGKCNGTQAKSRMAKFITGEITRHISEHKLDQQDTAVLIRKWPDAPILEREFKKCGIKYSFYKKEGIYQSIEMMELIYLVDAILHPYDATLLKKALLTKFFSAKPEHLVEFKIQDLSPELSTLLEKMHEQASKMNWPVLFQMIIEKTSLLDQIKSLNGEKTISIVKQILQDVSITAYNKKFDPVEFKKHLVNLYNNIYQGENEDLQKNDPENPGIRIMTIHASKGLQFSTVFIFGGFPNMTRDSYWIYHDSGKRVLDLMKEKSSESIYLNEVSAEDDRLYYVALTRAKNRLYLPEYTPMKISKDGNLIIAAEKMPALLREIDPSLVTRINYEAQMSVITDIKPDRPEINIRIEPSLAVQKKFDFIRRKITVSSFTSMKHQQVHLSEIEGGVFESPKYELDENFVSGIDGRRHDQGIDEPSLPPGTETGLMLHEILDKIDFSAVISAKAPGDLLAEKSVSFQLIDSSITKYFFNMSIQQKNLCRMETAKIIWNTLQTPIDGSNLKLGNLSSKMHEVEFFYNPGGSGPGKVIIHGYLDMIFQASGKYYFLDWKSNKLDDYGRKRLEKSIIESGYDLQYKIYTVAFLKWLKTGISDFNYDMFGGIYYIYLRGMNSTNSGEGIFFYRPADETEIIEFEKELKRSEP